MKDLKKRYFLVQLIQLSRVNKIVNKIKQELVNEISFLRIL